MDGESAPVARSLSEGRRSSGDLKLKKGVQGCHSSSKLPRLYNSGKNMTYSSDLYSRTRSTIFSCEVFHEVVGELVRSAFNSTSIRRIFVVAALDRAPWASYTSINVTSIGRAVRMCTSRALI